MIGEVLLGKILDFLSRQAWSAWVLFTNPIEVNPDKINPLSDDFTPITSLEIENRTSRTLYNVRVAGVSEQKFEVKVLDDGIEYENAVEHMSFNTRVLIVHCQDQTTGNFGWIVSLQRLEPQERILFNIKVDGNSIVHFKTMDYNLKETTIKENESGIVQIPFKQRELPKI